MAFMPPCVAASGHDDAKEMMFQPMAQHIDNFYCAYLRWFWTRTRIKVTFVVMDSDLHVPKMQDMFLHHRVEGHFAIQS
jgi:hypothetical protein